MFYNANIWTILALCNGECVNGWFEWVNGKNEWWIDEKKWKKLGLRLLFLLILNNASLFTLSLLWIVPKEQSYIFALPINNDNQKAFLEVVLCSLIIVSQRMFSVAECQVWNEDRDKYLYLQTQISR